MEELVEVHLRQIEAVNPTVNAIVTHTPERALAAARAADARRAAGEALGPLFGLPVAHKDLTPTAGVRTTFGSLAFTDHVPDHDSLIVERLRDAGAIMVGKTNTPEFGAGSQTFNAVFGATRNPYDTSKTCGGSSGGAAVALATGMVPIADGSDMGGSLRNPAAYCNVVGLRPSPGRVPTWPTEFPWSTLPVEGPMARSVEDAALMLDALCGADPRSPLALTAPEIPFRDSLEREFKGTRVAFSSNFGGTLPIESEVVDVVETARPVLETIGCDVVDACPEFGGADEAFKTWRAWLYAGLCGPLLKRHADQMKDTVVWNTEQGMRLSSADLLRAERHHAALFHRSREFSAGLRVSRFAGHTGDALRR